MHTLSLRKYVWPGIYNGILHDFYTCKRCCTHQGLGGGGGSGGGGEREGMGGGEGEGWKGTGEERGGGFTRVLIDVTRFRLTIKMQFLTSAPISSDRSINSLPF